MRIAFIDLNKGIRVGEPNIGILELMSYLKTRKNISMVLFDNPSKIIKNWQGFDVLAFSSMGFPLEKFIESGNAKRIKKIPRLKVIGGPGASILPRKGLEFSDIVVRGEGEIPFLNLLTLLEEKNLSADKTLEVLGAIELFNIENLIFKDSGCIRETKSRVYEPSEIDISKIDWRLMRSIPDYIKKWPYLAYLSSVRGISLVSSRSCPFNCAFCQPTIKDMFGPKIKYKKIDYIVEELLFLKRNFKINSFMFHDDTFTLDSKRVSDFCERLIDLRRKGVVFNWVCNTRAETLTLALAKKMRDAGCLEVRLGIETFDEGRRNSILNKGLSDKDIIKAIQIIHESDMKALGFFMIGLPSQTFKHILREIVWISKSDLDLASVSVFTPIPGTYLGKKYSIESYDSYYHTNKNKVSDLNGMVLDFLRISAILFFYFNPKRIILTTKQLFSPRTLLYNFKRFSGFS